MRKAIVICGFPGVGKSSAANNRANILDAESSAFSWNWNTEKPEKGRERNPAFPGNYIKFIQENMERYDAILVSTHQAVRYAMKAEGIQYLIAAPYVDEKNNYMIRYLQRGSSIDFIEDLYGNWEDYLSDLYNDGAPMISLGEGKYLSDILGVIAR